jgi:hypothetical protein
MLPGAPETVVAYHRLRLREIRSLYDQLDSDLDHYLGIERGVARDIDTLEVQFSELRETLISLGVDLDTNGTIQTPDNQAIPPPPTPRAKQPPSSVDFEDFAIEAGRYLRAPGLDPNTDPLLQVLSPTQTGEIKHSSWSEPWRGRSGVKEAGGQPLLESLQDYPGYRDVFCRS